MYLVFQKGVTTAYTIYNYASGMKILILRFYSQHQLGPWFEFVGVMIGGGGMGGGTVVDSVTEALP